MIDWLNGKIGSGIIVLIYGFIVFPLCYFVFHGQVWDMLLVIGATIVWYLVCLYPIRLMLTHRYKMKQMANQVQRIDSINDLLQIPIAAAAFGAFCGSEFCSVCYWLPVFHCYLSCHSFE
jgi:TM2 domain-containing membrane protein YozV